MLDYRRFFPAWRIPPSAIFLRRVKNERRNGQELQCLRAGDTLSKVFFFQPYKRKSYRILVRASNIKMELFLPHLTDASR